MPGLKFRILLDSENQEEVFRDVLINDTDDFETFFSAIMSAFQFTGNEMASFYVSNDHWDKGHEISLMDMSYGDEPEPDEPTVMKESRIKDFLIEPDQKFILVYDFMRMWIFLIELIGYEKETEGKPQLLLSVGAAPPEDSRSINEQEMLFSGEEEDSGDELGFEEYEDGIDDEDFSGFNEEYDY
jgi:hypothetical protein